MKLYRVTEFNFEKFLGLEQPLKVVMYAINGCPYCLAMGVVLDEMVAVYDGRVAIGRADAYEIPMRHTRTPIDAAPLLAAYKSDGSLVDTMLGARGRQEVLVWIEKLQERKQTMSKYWCKGKVIEVLQGLGGVWMVGTMKKNGTGRNRFVTKACPVRETEQESVADLDAYAKKHGLAKFDGEI